jgi:hypothetical protein
MNDYRLFNILHVILGLFIEFLPGLRDMTAIFDWPDNLGADNRSSFEK